MMITLLFSHWVGNFGLFLSERKQYAGVDTVGTNAIHTNQAAFAFAISKDRFLLYTLFIARNTAFEAKEAGHQLIKRGQIILLPCADSITRHSAISASLTQCVQGTNP
eukprot:scaffold346797_cov37-Prasinocladus_malaysianus.AAC.1